ncbi:MAG: hypothetical protein KDC38_06735, partial [Planctomycetes bacterium]|nr:hypothetical protein [Planctomycetota bacterium]
METNSSRDALAEIARFSAELAERRGQHAAALWSVSDFLGSLRGALVPFVDSTTLGEIPARLGIGPLDSDEYVLFVAQGEARVASYKADAEIQVAAVRRLPE